MSTLKLKNITNEYLSSFSRTKDEDFFSDTDTAKKKRPKGDFSIKNLAHLPEREKALLTFKAVLPHSEKLANELTRESEPVLDQPSWQDFSLLCGNKTTPDKSALNALKRTQTTVGSCVMATQIVNPHTDQKAIEEKQQITRTLNEETELQNNIDKALQNIKKGEATRLSLWQRENPLTHREYKKELDSFYFRRFGLARLNTSMFVLQAWKMFKDIFIHFGMLITLFSFITNGLAFAYMGAYSVTRLVFVGNGSIVSTTLEVSLAEWAMSLLTGPIIFPFYSLLRYSHWSLDTISKGDIVSWLDQVRLMQENSVVTVILFMIFEMVGIFLWYRAYNKFSKKRGVINFLAGHLAPFQDLIVSARQISELIAQHPALEKLYSRHLTKTRELLKESEKNSTLGQFIYNLEHTTFRNRWYFFNNTGRLLVTYKLLAKHKNQLADLIYEMGEVDVQVGIAKLVKESETYAPENRFVFGTFEESKNNLPKLKVNGMWNFLLDARVAVTNNLNIESNTIVLTGPNAGGKTVYILGNGMSTITNQTWGIAAAKTFQQTIFHKIITYVNVIQNLAAGLSLAEAGMEVLKQHKIILDRIDKPILAIIDEILNGVDPEVAKKYSYKILKDRSQSYPNCGTLLTTHYMNLTELAREDNKFKNKKVVVKIPGSEGRKFAYTYEIHDGVTEQNIVEMMLEEKGVL